MPLSIRIATRKSPLALWQATFVKTQLQRAHADLRVSLVPMTTQGDQWLAAPLATAGGKGLFVKALEDAILKGRADIAVHSMKDVPMVLPDGLHIPVIAQREDPRDALVSHHYRCIDDLPAGSRVGTSSLRRQYQLQQRRPDVQCTVLRGNVGTRLAKLDAGDYDAIILACAGLIRLGQADRIAQAIPVEYSLPAGGQGAIGIEARTDDVKTNPLLHVLHHPPTAAQVTAERALNHTLHGGCQAPIAAYAVTDPDDAKQLWLRAWVGEVESQRSICSEARAPYACAEALGVIVANDLLAQGAEQMLQASRH